MKTLNNSSKNYKSLALALICSLPSFFSFSQYSTLLGLPIAYWDFELNTDRTLPETAVDQAINSGFTYNGKFGGSNTSSCWRSGRGVSYGGTAAGTALSAGGWTTSTTASATTYYEFSFNTTGFSGISYLWDNYASGSVSSYPASGLSYSADGGASWSAYVSSYSTRNTWNAFIISLPASCDNNANVRIRISGYWSTNVNACTGSGTLAIDNLMVMATAIVPNGGIKNSLNENLIYTGTTSGSTGSSWLRCGTFTVNSNSTLNLDGSDIALGTATVAGALTILSGGTLDCGSANSRVLATAASGLSTVTINSGANLIVRSLNGITTAGTASGNIQTTTRTFNGAGNYTYQNSSSSSYSQVTGTGLPNALTGNLTINNTSGVNLSATSAVNNPGILYLTSGNLILSANNITATNITGGTASSYVKTNGAGVLIRPETGSLTTFPVGNSSYNPASITNSGTSDSYNMRVIDNVTNDGTGVGTTTSDPGVNRTWMISEATIGGSNVNLKLYWNGAGEEINAFSLANTPYMAHYSTAWDNIGGTITSNVADKSGITSFSPFTIKSTNSSLPVELISFQANCAGNNEVDVTWSTASEHNTSHFVVEKSRDGVNWITLNTLGAAGNSTTVMEYALTDNNEVSGTTYYRLTQFDNDGASETFNIASVNCGAQQTITSNLITYPNPSNGSFYLDFYTQDLTGPSSISLFDSRGVIIYRQDVLVEKGSNVFHIEDLESAPGMYYIQVSNGTTTSYIVKHSLR